MDERRGKDTLEPNKANFLLWSFPVALTIGALTIQITGLTVNYVIFGKANANYADFASPADLLIAGFKIPIVLIFGLLVALYFWILINLWRNETGILKKLLLSLVAAPVAALVLGAWLGTTVDSAVSNVDRSDQPAFWGRLLFGIMPFVKVTTDKPAITEVFNNAQKVQLLGRAGDYFLFSIDGNASIVARSAVTSMETRDSLTPKK